MDGVCSRCGDERDRPGQRYCRECQRDYRREWRKTHPQAAQQLKRDSVRAYAREYLKRGKLTRQPCQTCGGAQTQMHHENYDQPLNVRWFCRPCHEALHVEEIVSRKRLSRAPNIV